MGKKGTCFEGRIHRHCLPQRTPETEPWTPRGGFALLGNQSKDSELAVLEWGLGTEEEDLTENAEELGSLNINGGGGSRPFSSATGGLMGRAARLFPRHGVHRRMAPF